MDIELPLVTNLASGKGWRMRNIVCRAKVGEPAFEEMHERHVIAVVKSGMFNYHGKSGRALLHSGAVLVGNAGQCYACGHDHSNGDHCVALQLHDALYEEVASSAAGGMRFKFPTSRLTMQRELFYTTMALQKAVYDGELLKTEEAVLHHVEAVLRMSAQASSSSAAPHRQSSKIQTIIAYIEAHAAEPLTLQHLADHVALSRYHFLRVFKQTLGMTPYQFVMHTRLKRAVDLLLTSKLPIIDVGLASGFGDLSTFNKTFKTHIGKTPRMLRH